ncbi:MAG: tetratricopeptide repeat protein [Ferrovibrio sp.]
MTANHDPPDQNIGAGMAALQRGDIETALAHFVLASRTAPGDSGLLRTLAALNQHAGLYAEAWSAAETGLALLPEDAGFSLARIAAMGSAGFTATALSLARRQLLVVPGDAALLQQFGTLLLQSGDTSGALQAAQQALALKPDMASAHSLAAEAAYRLSDHAAARSHIDRAVALEPGNRGLRMARATMLLSLGDWHEGLKDYEARLQPDGNREIVRRGLTLPRWQGEDIGNRHLLVVCEQGVGDQLRFLRDILAMLPFCGQATVECAVRLVPLFRRSLPESVAVVAARERTEGRRHIFDYDWRDGNDRPDTWIEMGSLMLRLLERGVAPDRVAEQR